MGTLSNNSKVGDSKKDLILQTSGKVYIQVKDRFYEIKFKEDDSSSEEKDTEIPSKIIFEDDPSILDSNYKYPGEDYLIIAGGEFYRTSNNEYIKVDISSEQITTFTSPITITSLSAPFIISSTQLVKNLNAEYLNGNTSSDFAKINKNEVINSWTINNLTSKIISNKEGTALLDLETGVLEINSIKVNNLEVVNSSEVSTDEDSIQTESYDIINKKTYFSNGVTVSSIVQVDKLSSEIEDGIFTNENYLVGGYSIMELLSIAYNDGKLPDFSSLFECLSTLTSCYKLVNNTWSSYTLQESDFEEDNNANYPYKDYKYTPTSSSEYTKYKYGNDYTCYDKIYKKWYNINNYSGNIAEKYKGETYEITTDYNDLDSGVELSGTNENGIIEALVVGGTDTTIRIILSGTDCFYNNNVSISLYQEWERNTPTNEDNLQLYNTILECQTSQQELLGKNVSAIPKEGNILFENNSLNIIGKIEGISNSIFGTLKGYGLISEGNCYLINPNIAYTNSNNEVNIKFFNGGTSFLGVYNGSKWIQIGANGASSLVRSNMYNINNYSNTSNFGQLIVHDDGGTWLGNGIYVSTSGKVTIYNNAINWL